MGSKNFLTAVLIAVAYFVVGKIELLFSFPSSDVSPLWPAAGVALAALLVFGWRLWYGVAIGSFVLAVSTGMPVTSAAFVASGNALEALLAVWFLSRFGF